MKNICFIVVALMGLLSSCCKTDPGYERTHRPLSKGDVQFLELATVDNLAGIAIDTMAASRSTDAALRGLAPDMAATLTASQSEIHSIATYHNVTLPITPTAEQAAAINSLAALPAHSFDSAYLHRRNAMAHQTADHFSAVLTGNSHPWLRQYAGMYIGRLQEHARLTDSLIHARP